jgi:hypothetical protein
MNTDLKTLREQSSRTQTLKYWTWFLSVYIGVIRGFLVFQPSFSVEWSLASGPVADAVKF